MLRRRGNINGQFGTDAYDIDTLYSRIGSTGDIWFEDLNVDGAVTRGDVDTLVRTIFRTEYGDADLDRYVDIQDFNTLATHFDPRGGARIRAWAMGNFDGDGDTDIQDFNTLATHFNPRGFGGAAPTLLGTTALSGGSITQPTASASAAAASVAAPSGELALVVDVDTGTISLLGNAAIVNAFQIVSNGDGLLVDAEMDADVLAFLLGTATGFYSEGSLSNVAVDGSFDLGTIYNLLLDTRDLAFTYTVGGTPGESVGSVTYIGTNVPEAATCLLVLPGLLPLLRRRR